MGSSARNPQVVSFADCTLDLQTAELRRNGTKLTLQDQPFQILTALMETPGQLVTREELIRRLWPNGTFVDFDQSLNKAVARLREALGDDADSPRFVETLPRKGYRWVGPQVFGGGSSFQESDRDEQSPREDSQESSRSNLRNIRSRYLLVIALVLVVIVLVLAAGVLWQNEIGISSLLTRPTPIRSVVVLPLENLSGDLSQDYLVDGITDALITNLAEHMSARVISRTSAMHFKGTRKALPEIARELSVDVVVEGTVAKSGNLLRINVQLIRAADDSHLFAHAYEAEVRNILVVQNQVAGDIADRLQSSTTENHDVRERVPTDRPSGKHDSPGTESHDLYLHGLYLSNTFTYDGVQKAISYFKQSLTADPQNALAYAGLAESYCWMGDLLYLSPTKAYPEAKTAALNALNLDSNLAGAHNVLAWIAYAYDWDTLTAEREFSRSLDLNANSAKTHAWFATYLAHVGRHSEALQHMDQARQLDPFSLEILNEEFMPLYFSRQYEKAIEVSQQALAMDRTSELARGHLIYLYEITGQFEKAIAEAERGAIIQGESVPVASRLAASYRNALSRDGANGYWLKRFSAAVQESNRKWVDPVDIALLAARLHRNEEALRWLERAYDQRTIAVYVDNDPGFEQLRIDPHFQGLVRRISHGRYGEAAIDSGGVLPSRPMPH